MQRGLRWTQMATILQTRLTWHTIRLAVKNIDWSSIGNSHQHLHVYFAQGPSLELLCLRVTSGPPHRPLAPPLVALPTISGLVCLLRLMWPRCDT